MNRKLFLIFSVLLLILGAIPRSIELFNHNYLFENDQGMYFQAVKRIVVDHKLTLIGTEVGGKGGFFQGPGWYYLLAIPFVIWHGDPYGAMVLMFLSGIGTILVSIYLGQRLFGSVTGLCIGLLIAVSPTLVPQSRFIWPPFLISFLSVFFVYFLYEVLDEKEKAIPIEAFIIGLMFHFEVATGVALFLQSSFLIPWLLRRYLFSFRTFIRSVLLFFLPLTPLILFEVKHNFLGFRGIVQSFFDTRHGGLSVSRSDVAMIFENHKVVFYQTMLSIWKLPGIPGLIVIILLTVGTIIYLSDKREKKATKRFVFFLFTSPLSLFLVFLLYPSALWGWWILELPIFYCWLAGILIGYCIKRNNKLKFVMVAMIIAIIFSFSVYIYQIIKKDFHDFGGVHKIKGKIAAIDAVYADAGKAPFNMLIFAPPVYTYPYDYLFWWYGKRTYGYTPSFVMKGLVYLLIEPDPHQPWTYKGWLETVIKSGKVLDTMILPSGFIVQKRQFD